MLMHVLIDGLQALVPHILVVGIQGGPDSVLGVVPDGLEHLVLRLIGGIFKLGLADLSLHPLDELNDLLVGFVAGHDAVVHVLVGDLVGACLDHGNALVGGGHGDSHLAHLPLLGGGVDDELAVDQAHGNAGNGSVPGHIRDGQGDGGADEGGDLRGIVLVHGHDGAHDGNVVAHILGEQGPDGPVDHAAGKGGFLRRTALPLQEGTGDLAHRIKFFLKVHGKGEKVDTVPRLSGCGDRYMDHSVPIAHQALPVGQLSHFPGLYHQRTASQFCLKHSKILEHFTRSFLPGSQMTPGRFLSERRSCLTRKQAGRGCSGWFACKTVPPLKKSERL